MGSAPLNAVFVFLFFFSECGVAVSRPKGKVVGGTHSAFGEWPWQVVILPVSCFLYVNPPKRH